MLEAKRHPPRIELWVNKESGQDLHLQASEKMKLSRMVLRINSAKILSGVDSASTVPVYHCKFLVAQTKWYLRFHHI